MDFCGLVDIFFRFWWKVVFIEVELSELESLESNSEVMVEVLPRSSAMDSRPGWSESAASVLVKR